MAATLAALDECRERVPGCADDRELIALVAAGDQGAFRELFRRHAPGATALARRVLRDAALAEDAVQEAFLAVWRDADAYDPTRLSVRSWVTVLVHRRAVDRVRREEAHRRRATAAIGSVDPSNDLEDVLDAVDGVRERADLRRALAGLPPEQREVLRRLYFDGGTCTRVAGDLGIPVGTVKSRARLALIRLRVSLGT